MKSLAKRRLEILRRVEASDAYLLYQQFYAHEIGGHEEYVHPEWTDEEFYEIGQLVRRGFLEISTTKGDEPWLGGGEPEAIYRETSIFLTPEGHDFLENVSILRYALNNVKKNWPTVAVGIILSVTTALLVSWAEYYWGPGT